MTSADFRRDVMRRRKVVLEMKSLGRWFPLVPPVVEKKSNNILELFTGETVHSRYRPTYITSTVTCPP